MNSERRWFLLFAAWMIAIVATAGSLFFSEVMHFPPCVLCWYQRIAMYPLSLLLAVALFPFEMKVIRLTSPLVAIGWMISVYHNLLYYHLIPSSVSPCRQGISCTTVYIEWLGFITIPLLSLMAFSLIALIYLYLVKKHE